MAIVLIGSSTSVPTSAFALRLRTRLGAVALGISGASVNTWIRKVTGEAANTYSGKDVFVYLPGQLDVPSVASIQQLQNLLKQKGAKSVFWILPPVFPGDRERITGGTANAILRAGVPLVSRIRMPLSASDVTTDGVHLKAPAQIRLADRVAEGLPGDSFDSSTPPVITPVPSEVPPVSFVPSVQEAGVGLGVLLLGVLGLGAAAYFISR